MARKIMMYTLIVCFLTGCFFTVKEMTLDPDKGITHTKEDQYGISEQAQRTGR